MARLIYKSVYELLAKWKKNGCKGRGWNGNIVIASPFSEVRNVLKSKYIISIVSESDHINVFCYTIQSINTHAQ